MADDDDARAERIRSDCGMGPAACIAIGTGLASVARPLASLCLDYNEIGTAGLRHLNRCNALGAVEDVSLAFCGLVDVSLLASVLAGPSACIRSPPARHTAACAAERSCHVYVGDWTCPGTGSRRSA